MKTIYTFLKFWPVKALGTLVLFGLLYGCNLNHDEYDTCMGYGTSVSEMVGPDSAPVNQPVTFLVGSYSGGAVSFLKLAAAQDANIHNLEVLTRVDRCGNIHTMDQRDDTTSYTFTPTIPGMHYLRLHQPDNSIKLDSVLITAAY